MCAFLLVVACIFLFVAVVPRSHKKEKPN